MYMYVLHYCTKAAMGIVAPTVAASLSPPSQRSQGSDATVEPAEKPRGVAQTAGGVRRSGRAFKCAYCGHGSHTSGGGSRPHSTSTEAVARNEMLFAILHQQPLLLHQARAAASFQDPFIVAIRTLW